MKKCSAGACPPPNARQNLVIEQPFAYTALSINKSRFGANVAAEANNVKY